MAIAPELVPIRGIAHLSNGNQTVEKDFNTWPTYCELVTRFPLRSSDGFYVHVERAERDSVFQIGVITPDVR